jgi:hypothetical protein
MLKKMQSQPAKPTINRPIVLKRKVGYEDENAEERQTKRVNIGNKHAKN